MKKYLSLLMLVLTLAGCSTKNNVKDDVGHPTVASNGVVTFVKKVDNVQASISRSVDSGNVEGIVKDFYDNYLNPLIAKINSELGRANIENDAYFKFDKAGNVLEMGLKTNVQGSNWAQLYKFKPTENNIPVFMYDWDVMEKYYVEEKETGGVDINTNNPNQTYYSYEGNNKKISFTIDAGVYKENNWSSSSDDRHLILDNTGKVVGAKLGSYPNIPIYNYESFGIWNVVKDNGETNSKENVNFYTQTGTNQYTPIYNDLRVEFDYENGKIKFYNQDTYLGYAENTTFSWTGNEFIIERIVNNITHYARVKYNIKRQVISYTIKDNSLKEGNLEYDSKYGVLSKAIETLNGTEIRNYKIEYDDGANSNGLFNGFKMTEIWTNYNSTYDSNTGEFTYTFEAPDTTIVEIEYYRNPSTGDITEVYTNLNLGERANIKGNFVPKK